MSARASFSRTSLSSRASFSQDFLEYAHHPSIDQLSQAALSDDESKNHLSVKHALLRKESQYERLYNVGRDKKSVESHDALDADSANNASEYEEINMFTRENVAIYFHYASVGLCDGLAFGTAKSFCYYVWPEENNNTCSVAGSVVQLAWNIKIFIAFFSEANRPCGMKRKPYMIVGWLLALCVMAVLAMTADGLSFYEYIFLAATFEFFMMIADANADGYTVELSKLESPERRGKILANGQLCRFVMNMMAGVVQSFLLNGPSTNPPGQGFSWGLTVGEMYWLMLGAVIPTLLPALYFFREKRRRSSIGGYIHHQQQHPGNNSSGPYSKIPPPSSSSSASSTSILSNKREGGGAKARPADEAGTGTGTTMAKQLSEVWHVMHNVTVFFIMIWSLGNVVLAGASNRVSLIMEGSIIQMSQLLFGIDNISTYLTLSVGIWLFKTYLINYNWRITQVWTTFIVASLNCLWLVPVLTSFRNPWFAVFIDSSEQFVSGITQVMISMAVIELAPAMLEGTTYELLISVSNAFITLNVVVSTQLMAPFRLAEIDKDNDDASANRRMAEYTLLISGINILGVASSVWFFPRNRKQCRDWKEWGGHRFSVAISALVFSVFALIYSFTCMVLSVLPSTSCLKFVGGNGCANGPDF